MATLVLASSKGGVGKTTTALTLASVLTHHKQPTTLVDADPNAPIINWARRFPDLVPPLLNVRAAIGAEVDEVIDKAADPFVIVDLEGSKNREVSVGIGWADLVLIPMKGSQLDADEAANVIKLIKRQEKIFRRPIPYRVFFSGTNALISRTRKNLEQQFREQEIPLLETHMVDRAAFQLPFAIGGTIYDLTAADTKNPDYAIENAEAFAAEVSACLKQAAIPAGERAYG